MMTSFSGLFKALTIVALSLLTAGSPGPPAGTEAAGSSSARFAAAMTAGPCFADATTLCLNGGRFKVQVAWSVPTQGTSGVGTGVALTGDTGYFWFFSSNNVELVIKVVDGRAFNGKFWVFYGALSNVAYTITVTDTVTGTVKTYSNPFGTLASVADAAAFDGGGASAVIGPASSEDAGWLPMGPAAARQLGEGAACVPDSTTLCLNNNRFKVQVSWRVPAQGTSGPGVAVPLTGDTGEFWFFSSNNIELVIKAVDGTAFNGRFWVFYGALSNVEYTITVTDTATGAVKTYFNPFGSLASVADTAAFGGGPAPTPTNPGPTPTPTPTPSASSTRIVNVGQGGSTRFTDAVTGTSSTSIHVGDTVQWKFLDNSTYHSATSGVCTGVPDYYNDGGCTPDGNWDSGQLISPATFSKKFTTAGSFRYYCTVHGSMMTGTVDVNP